jgi:hypothetical protein
MSKKTPSLENPSPTEAKATGNSVAAPWPTEPLIAAWLGLPWINLSCQAWSAWLEFCGVGAASREPAGADERRQAGMSWLPQIESTVVPMRRRDDLPGAEAAKISMRIRVPPLPWEAGNGSVIAIDSLRPRIVGTTKKIPPTTH